MVLQFITFKQLLHRAEMVRPHNDFSSFFGSIFPHVLHHCREHLSSAPFVTSCKNCLRTFLHFACSSCFHFSFWVCPLIQDCVLLLVFFFQVVPLFKAAKLCDWVCEWLWKPCNSPSTTLPPGLNLSRHVQSYCFTFANRKLHVKINWKQSLPLQLQTYEDQCDTVYETQSKCEPSYKQICTGSYER